MSKTWLITGANRGFGYQIATAALAAGDTVVATARHPEQAAEALGEHGDRLITLRLDVTDESSIEAVVTAVVERLGRIDVLVNNAGYGQLGVFEELSAASIERQSSRALRRRAVQCLMGHHGGQAQRCAGRRHRPRVDQAHRSVHVGHGQDRDSSPHPRA